LLFDNLRSFWLKAALAICRFSGLTQKLFYEYIWLALKAGAFSGAKEKNMNGESASFRLYSFLNCPFEKFRD
jgi:hypothetical protein